MNTEQLKTAEQFLQESFERAKVKYPEENWKEFDEVKIEREFIGEAMEIFASQESKRAVEKDRESRWISVKERLPEYGVNVIVYGGHTGTRINVAWYDRQLKMFTRLNSQREFVNCTHWQPLPEPPKL